MNEASIENWCAALRHGEIRAVCVNSAQAIRQANPPRSVSGNQAERLIFPGAFNPLHGGHRAMAEIAEDVTGGCVEFEISIDNVDKPPLTLRDIKTRLQQFPPTQKVWLTRAMRFPRKAELFPEATFVVGADTIARIADRKYYDGEEEQRRAATQRIAALGGRFLVFGRSRRGEFKTLEALDLPSDLRAICQGVTGETFRFDVSSTEIRIANGG